MTLDTMYLTLEDSVASITLNRPTILNCINEAWLRDFSAILDELVLRQPRVVVIRGSGRAFCTGIDLTALAHNAISTAFFESWEMALRRLELLSSIVIAAVHGHCIGGGLQLALACDLRLARDDSHFGITAVREGIIPGMGVWRIARHVGLSRAKRLALTADVVDTDTAHEWGLVDYVASADSFEQRLTALTDRLLHMASTSTQSTKELIQLAFDMPFEPFLDAFRGRQVKALASDEHQRAMAHYLAERGRRRGRATVAGASSGLANHG